MVEINLKDIIFHYRNFYNKDYSEFKISVNDINNVDKLLMTFAKKKLTIYTEYCWEILIEKLDEKYLSDELIDILCKNKIQLIDLAHKNFKSETLLKIYQADKNCIEALETALSNDFYNDSIDLIKFTKIYSQFYDDYIYLKIIIEYYLYCKFSTIHYNKALFLARQIDKINKNDILSNDCIKFNLIIYENNLNENFYSTNDLIIILALVYNKNSSIERIRNNFRNIEYPNKYLKKLIYNQIETVLQLRKLWVLN